MLERCCILPRRPEVRVGFLAGALDAAGRSEGRGRKRAAARRSRAQLGAVPELDSIAVVNVITALEERFDITVADDEIGAATFETLGSLTRFVEEKLAG